MFSRRSLATRHFTPAEPGRDRGYAQASGAFGHHEHCAGGLDLSIRPTLTDFGTMAPWHLGGRGCRSRWS